MPNNSVKNVWFVTGSQHLYGPGVLATVAANSQAMVKELNETAGLNVKLLWQPTVKTPEEIYAICQAASADENCVGIVLWMHTFSPAKMWIAGLNVLSKPWLHLHTQFNAALPWADIDMNYMNLHQSAHGDREFGHIGSRMRIDRKVVAGYWRNKDVQQQMDDWCRAASGWHESRHLKVARFGDNMRQVAVTEGDKVAAQIQFGYEVNAYCVADLVELVNQVSAADIQQQIELYKNDYIIAAETLSDAHQFSMIENEARLELGMLKFLQQGNYKAFTNCFENLAGLSGLPGLATQRLMSQGYGYGGEGDWKTSAMVRIMKVMGEGRVGGTSFMEDYTYNFGDVDQVLGAHMLEICPSISQAKPRLEVHRHTIGVKCDIARLLFTAAAGPSINVSPVDMGNRFRIIINEAETVRPPADLPNLPVGSALWEPKPNLSIASAAWIYAGGAHHAAYSQQVNTAMIVDYAEMAGVETVVIDADTTIRNFKSELRNNAAYYHLNRGL